ncbi:MAG: DUF3857 domain-containing transglutaminase family protein [Alphaproteobacteria bacterium]|nr:DUF3857 domain-containing transglutaminase family protein [Alphaproteobacteria bacterium]
MIFRLLIAAPAALVAAIATLATGTELTGLGSGDRILGGRLLHEDGEVRVYSAPTPRWTRDFDLASLSADDAPGQGGVAYLLDDRQATVAGPEPTVFRRIAGEAVTLQGVSDLSVFTLQIANDFQRIYIHEADIIRDGQTLDRIDDLVVSAGAAPAIDAETQQLSEVRTIIMRVPGVRAGDRVLVSYSLAGGHPLVRHGQAAFAEPVGAAFAHVRRSIRAPEGSQTAGIGQFADAVRTTANGVTEHVFLDGPASPRPGFTDAPAWRVGDWAMVSTTPDWRTVSEWGSELFAPVRSDAVDAVAGQIAAEHETREAQIAAALAFVQREVRYFAVLFGAGGYEPVHPDETLRLGEGECKAKSLLLVSILDALGFEAEVAFVSSGIGPMLAELPPSEAVFDHVIVTVTHEGRRYWLEPSTFEQAGTLQTLAQPDYGYALIADGESTLQSMDVVLEEPTLEVDTRLQISSMQAGAIHRMAVRVTVSGPAADQARVIEAMAGRAQMLQHLRTVAAAGVAGWREASPAVVRDDPVANTVTAEFDWEIRLVEAARETDNLATAIFPIHGAMPPFALPGGKRGMPLALPFPHVARHEVRVSLPKGEEGEPGWTDVPARDVTFENAAFFLQVRVRPLEDRIEAGARLEIRSRELAPAEFAAVGAEYQAALEALTLVLTDRSDPEIAAALERMFGREPSDSPRS